MKIEFHKWKKQLLVADIAIASIIVILFGIPRPDFVMIGVYFLLYPYLLLTQRRTAVYHLFLASAMAVTWLSIAKEQYGYNQDLLTIFGLNAYPLFAVAIGLFGAYMVYSHFEHRFKKSGFIKKVAFFLALYWPVLIIVETLAYHVFGIANVSTGAYPGLPLCDCMHAPRWMQISYFSLGPIFFGLVKLFRLQNPHWVKKK